MSHWVTVYSERPFWWHWNAERQDSGHALTRNGALRAGWRVHRRLARKARRTERRRARVVRTSFSDER